MLLMGFNVFIEQVMYIDCNMVEYEFFQAIVCVNCIYDGKDYGLIVDYYGIRIDEVFVMYDVEDLIDFYFDILIELFKFED